MLYQNAHAANEDICTHTTGENICVPYVLTDYTYRPLTCGSNGYYDSEEVALAAYMSYKNAQSETTQFSLSGGAWRVETGQYSRECYSTNTSPTYKTFGTDFTEVELGNVKEYTLTINRSVGQPATQVIEDRAVISRSRQAQCPNGSYGLSKSVDGQSTWICELRSGGFYIAPVASNNGSCAAAPEGNPCDLSTGAKTHVEQDISFAGELSFTRIYSTLAGSSIADSNLSNWSHSYNKRLISNPTLSSAWNYDGLKSSRHESAKDACESGWLEIRNSFSKGDYANLPATYVAEPTNGKHCQLQVAGSNSFSFEVYERKSSWPSLSSLSGHLTIVHPSGKRYSFTNNNGSWVSQSSKSVTLDYVSGKYTFTDEQGMKEKYSTYGRLVSITSLTGLETTLAYDNSGQGRLTTITDSFGRQMTLDYDAYGNFTRLNLPDSIFIDYSFGASRRLTSATYPDGTIKTYHYEDADFPNHLTGITDQNGNRFATWAYDGQGRAVSSEHTGGAEKATFTYLSDGSAKATDSNGLTRTYTFTTINGKKLISNIDGQRCHNCLLGDGKSFTYDSEGYVLTQTDWTGKTTRFERNARGLVTKLFNADGTADQTETVFEWLPDLPLVSKVTESGRVTDFTYDTGKLTSVKVTDSATAEIRETSYTYYANGLVHTINGPRTDVSDITTYEYNASGELTKVTNALGHDTVMQAHTTLGLPGEVLDANGVLSKLSYDYQGRITSNTVAFGTSAESTTSYDYTPAGDLDKITYGNGAFEQYGYDDARRLTSITNNLGESITFARDSVSNVTGYTIKDGSGTTTFSSSTGFDYANLREHLTNGVGKQTIRHLDAVGKLSQVVNPNGASFTYTYDALGQLEKEVDAISGETSFSYTPLGYLQSVTDPEGLVTEYARNAFGEMDYRTSPDTGGTDFSYDSAGNLVAETDARGITVTYWYDALNRLTNENYPNQDDNVTYLYDGENASNGIGRLTTVIDKGGVSWFNYDERGNLKDSNVTLNGTIYSTSYEYDGNDEIVWIAYPSGHGVKYYRNSIGNVTGVELHADGQVTQLAYDVSHNPFGDLSFFNMGNGLSSYEEKDLAYQTSYRNVPAKIDEGLAYDDNGNLNGITDYLDSTKSKTFGYDDLDRLTSEDAALDFDYVYDGIGNRTQKTQGTAVTSYNYPSGSHQLSDTTGAEAKSYVYDAAGNLTSDGLRTMTYTADGHIGSVQKNGTHTYVYNSERQRIAKTVSGVTTYYHYDQAGNLILETASDGTVQKEYVYLAGRPIAMWVPDSTSTVPTGSVYAKVQHSGKYLDVISGSLDHGANVVQRSVAPVGQWTLEEVAQDNGQSFYHLTSSISGQCLDVATLSMNPGVNVLQHWCSQDSWGQQWRLTDSSGGKEIRNRYNDQCVSVGGGSQDDDGNVVVWTCGSDSGNAYPDQLWTLSAAQ